MLQSEPITYLLSLISMEYKITVCSMLVYVTELLLNFILISLDFFLVMMLDLLPSGILTIPSRTAD